MTTTQDEFAGRSGSALSEWLGPLLPEPDAWLCAWGDEWDPDRWRQWHDLSDPMPEVWDEAPTWVVRHYSEATLRAAIAGAVAAERAQQHAAREELVAAWNDLPEALRCHPGLKRLYAAAQRA